ncbi:MAG TPA: hypothetical protein VGK72_07610, partial [Chthoniobacterales bacterium]
MKLYSSLLGATATLGLALFNSAALAQPVSGQTEVAQAHWQALVNQPSFDTDTALLLTDGTVMVHEYSSQNWWRLTPDING